MSKTPPELTYDEIIMAFKTHICLEKNILESQHQFLSTYQAENLTITDYIAVLRRDILDCKLISPSNCKVSIADIVLH